MAVKKFHLEQVLKYRQEMERMCKHEFASAKQNLEHAHDQLMQEEAQVRDLSHEFSHRQGELQSIDELCHYINFFARKREDIRNQKERVDMLGSIMNQRRDVLIDATKDKKVLESLKDRKAEEFKLAMRLKEQDFLDEISIQKNEQGI